MSYEDKTVDEKLPICPIAACRGKFYFNGTADELGVLEFCPAPVFSKITISDVIDGFFGYMNYAHVYLVESDDELNMACTLFGFDLKTIYEVKEPIRWISRDNGGAELKSSVIARSLCSHGILVLRMRLRSMS
ncbi:hypothetical protein E2562_019270 [Oryza meyeriana var. granulata]|uniref:Uncharacterized protein n=1 Tax=Oryza meyeriana var. granulata TaxID=110450 RepID=A0A6G1FAF8_9ORYZ|nr:hypothetical protein E2562_019270 [Oryza meyeriana var. granulata]